MAINTQSIACINDAFRQNPTRLGRMIVTRCVMNLADRHDDAFAQLIRAVRDFRAFTSDNDPYGEHDFGAIDLLGQKWFWKIDYFADETCTRGADNPGHSEACFRVLTIMHASEY